jgi:hypothetical protein
MDEMKKVCDVCGRKIGFCWDIATRRKVVLDVEQRVYTPTPLSDTADANDGFPAIRNSISAAVHLCGGKE